MKIAYFSRDKGACSYYRVDLPNQTLHRNGAAEVWKIEKGDSSEKISKALDGADLVIIPRVSDSIFLDLIAQIQTRGVKVAVEYDDDLFNVSPLSPHYAEFGAEEVTIEMEGQNVELWKDGANINLAANRKRQENIAEAMRRADFTIVTTTILAAAFAKYTNRIAVLPNCVDTRLWQPLPLKETGEIRLYWSGGASHYEDFAMLSQPLGRIMAKYPQTKLVIMGSVFEGTIADLPKERVEVHDWVNVEAYPYKTAILNPTIALIPLKASQFSACKSSIKWVEQAALGVPSVMSMVSPYQEMFDGENAVMVADNSPEQWFYGLSMLIEDSILRAKVGGAAKRTVDAQFDINTQYPQWVAAYQRFL